MVENKKEKELERRIAEIKKKIATIGLMHPGSLRQQYNICGTPGCRCKDKENPMKHGPYYNLSFTFGGKNRTRFIRAGRVREFKVYTANYAEFRKYMDELIGLSMEIIDMKGDKKS